MKAAAFAKQRGEVKALSLKHLEEYLKALEAEGIKPSQKTPIILPDYRNPEVKGKGEVNN
jgi:hypothetical protein